jgi:hypothetical protein
MPAHGHWFSYFRSSISCCYYSIRIRMFMHGCIPAPFAFACSYMPASACVSY